VSTSSLPVKENVLAAKEFLARQKELSSKASVGRSGVLGAGSAPGSSGVAGRTDSNSSSSGAAKAAQSRRKQHEEAVAARMMGRYQMLSAKMPGAELASRGQARGLAATKVGGLGQGSGASKRTVAKGTGKGATRARPSSPAAQVEAAKHAAEMRELFEKHRHRNFEHFALSQMGNGHVSGRNYASHSGGGHGGPHDRISSPETSPLGRASSPVREMPLPPVEETGWRFERVKAK